MTSPQRLPTSLTPLDKALDALLQGVEPAAPVELTLAEALRGVAADMPPLQAHPPRDIAAVDGYAFGARDLVGASSYSPLPLTTSPVWVEAGEVMPDGCDCVLDSDSVDLSGPMPQVLTEAIPGQGVRRAGGDIAAGSFVAEAGQQVLPCDLLMADLEMPELTGDEMARRIRLGRPDLKVLYVTGHIDRLLDERPVLWEGEAYLDKPFSADGLLEAISLLLFGVLRTKTRSAAL